jgi:4-hydroxy-tetrahydrodipicolinate synthase
MFASPIDVPTIARLAELPRIVGIKDSSGDIAYVGRVLHAVKTVRPEFSFLCGWEPALLPALLLGADGGTHASAGVVPEVTGALYRAATAGDWAAAREAHYRLLPLFDAMLGAGDFPLGFRLGVECRGFRLGASRQPLGETVTAGLETLASELAQAVNRAL